MQWSDLNMSERDALMKLYLKNGITSLSAMKEHYNNYATGRSIEDKTVHKYQTGGPYDDKYKFLIRESQVAAADNTRVVLPPSSIEIAKARDEYEVQQRQAAMIRAAQNQPQLIADTRTDSDRKHEAQRREKQAKLDVTRAAQRDFMSLGRSNTESQQAAVMAMPYVAEAATNYLRNGNITRDLGYFVPGVSNVLMAQDANQQINNSQYKSAVMSAVSALSIPTVLKVNKVIASPNKSKAFVDNFITPNDRIEGTLSKKLLLNLLERNAGDAHPTIKNIFKNTNHSLDDLYITGLFPEKSPLTKITNPYLQKEMEMIISPNYSTSLGNSVAHVTSETPLYSMNLIPRESPIYKRATSRLQSNNFTGWRPSQTHNSASFGRLNSMPSKDVGGHWERLTKDKNLWTDEIYDLQHFTPNAYEKSWGQLSFPKKVALEVLNRAWTPFSLYGKRTYLKPIDELKEAKFVTSDDGFIFEEMPSL